MSLSQIELVWVRVRVELECFWVNPREDNKVSEFQQCRIWIQDGWNSRCQNSRWSPSLSWVWMNEWSFFVQMVGREMWVKFVFVTNGGNQSWQVCVSLRGQTKMADSKMAKSKMAEFKIAAIIKMSAEWMSLSPDWIRISQSQIGVRVFLSESERRKQGVWIPQCRS